ncbi:tetratricopeptide repeat protein [Lentzea sp. NPDC058436]|uniref:tetratricopeptide repeat protein n=1 Tax=Lentzea sp. NPDC058436 TaxID=3346499 RepID=UPI00364FF14D
MGAQTELAVDDAAAIYTEGGFLLVQAKKGLKLEAGPKAALGDALAQVVVLDRDGIPDGLPGGHRRPLERTKDLVLIASDSGASGSIRKNMRRITERLRTLPEGLPLAHAAAGEEAGEHALSILVGHLHHSYNSVHGVEAGESDIRRIASLMLIRSVELQDGESQYESAITILRSLLEDRREAEAGWGWLLWRMQKISESREWIDCDKLRVEFGEHFTLVKGEGSSLGQKVAIGPGDNYNRSAASDGETFGRRHEGTTISVSPIIGISAPVRKLVGRKLEIDLLLDSLKPARESSGERSIPTVSVIVGMGGVGKSALAEQVAVQAVSNNWFRGGALHLRFGFESIGDSGESRVALEPILRSLGVPGAQIPEYRADQISMLHSLFHEFDSRGDRILFVLDGVSESSQILDVIPKGGQHRVIVTTRHTLNLGPVTTVSMKILDPCSSIELLESVLLERNKVDERIRVDESKAIELARLCGHLPLALLISGSLLADDLSLTVDMLARNLKEEMNEVGLDALVYGDQAISTSFEVSWRRLNVKHPEAAKLLQYIAVVPGIDIGTSAAAEILGSTPARIRPQLRILQQAHLLDAAAERWSMHDLVRKYVKHQPLSEEDFDVVSNRFQTYYLERANSFDQQLRRVQKTGEESAAHVQSLDWFDIERVNLISLVKWAATVGDYMYAAPLSFSLTNYFSARRYLADWLETAQCVVNASKDHPAVLSTALEVLGRALQEARYFDRAVVAHLHAVDLFTLIGERLEAAGSLNSLGLAYRQLRRFNEAAAAHLKASLIGAELKDLDLEANSLNNLGLDLRYLEELDQALDAHRKALELYQRDGNKSGLAMSWNNIGLVYRAKGMPKDSASAHEAAIRIFEECADTFGRCTALLNLSQALVEARDFRKAAKVGHSAVELFDSLGDRYHSAVALGARAHALYCDGRDHEAMDDAKRALAIFSELESAVDEAKVLAILAQCYGRLGELQDAINILTQASGAYRRADLAAEEAAVFDEQGAIFCELKDFIGAIGAYRKALKVCRDAGFFEFESEVLMHLSHAYLAIGNHDKAIAGMRMAAGVASGVGDKSREGAALNDLGVILHDSGRDDEARQACMGAAGVFRDLGDNVYLGAALMNLAEIADAQSARQEAIGHWQSALEIFEAEGLLEHASAVKQLLVDKGGN